MEMNKLFKNCSVDCRGKAREIESPKNEQYEKRAEKFEEKYVRINTQKQKAYREAEGTVCILISMTEGWIYYV